MRCARFRSLLAGIGLLFAGKATFARAEVIVLQSGYDEQNGVGWSAGQLDLGTTYLTTGASNLGFAIPFGPLDFLAAQNGSTAYTKAPLTSGSFNVYIPSLFFPYPQAQWINTSPATLVARTALYAMPFQVTTTNIASATLSMKWAVDDWLGDPVASDPNPIGVFLNGQPVPSAISGGTFGSLSQASDSNIGPLLVTGQNWFYFYQRDLNAGASGSMFGATLTITPEPASSSLVMVCLLAAAGWCRSRVRAGRARSRIGRRVIADRSLRDRG